MAPREQAAAQALLRALEFEGCTPYELTAARYTELRRQRPQIGLPRATTLTAVCGSWNQALRLVA